MASVSGIEGSTKVEATKAALLDGALYNLHREISRLEDLNNRISGIEDIPDPPSTKEKQEPVLEFMLANAPANINELTERIKDIRIQISNKLF